MVCVIYDLSRISRNAELNGIIIIIIKNNYRNYLAML